MTDSAPKCAWSALSVRQPYAALILASIKMYEARTWLPGKPYGAICLHASSQLAVGWKDNRFIREGLEAAGIDVDAVQDLPRSRIVGIVDIARVLVEDKEKARLSKRDRYLCSPDGDVSDVVLWKLVRPYIFPEPQPCNGRLFLWPVPSKVSKALNLDLLT